MSGNEQNGFNNVDNLTPFEYALAGVEVPDVLDSPSLAVVEQMRELAAEVNDAPVTQPRLREFINNGGSIARRSDRRSLRRRRHNATSPLPENGGFIDITPVGLNDDDEADSGFAAPAAASAVAAAGAVAAVSAAAMDGDKAETELDAGVEAGVEAGLNADLEADPALEQPVDELRLDVDQPDIDLTKIEAGVDTEVEVDADVDIDVDPVPAELSLDAEVADDGLVEEFPDSEVDLEPDLEPEHTADLEPELTADGEDEHDSEFEVEHDLVLDDVVAAAGDDDLGLEELSAPALFDGPGPEIPDPPRLFPDVPDLIENRDDQGRFIEGIPPVAEPALGADAEEDDEAAILVPATAAGVLGVLENPAAGAGDAQPLHVAATTGPTAAEAATGSRFGGTFWALVGTAAAAAALSIGGLWWANGLGNSTETAGADGSGQLIDDELDQGTAEDGGRDTGDIPSTAAGAEGGQDGADADTDSNTDDFGADDAGRASAGDDGASGDSTDGDNQVVEVDPTTTSTPATTDGSSGQTSVTETPTSPNTVDTTSSTEATTTQPPTTNPPTTKPPTTRPPTTQRPITTVPPTTRPTLPPTTPRPTSPPRPAYIGDSVNVGDYSGEGARNVRVDLFEDSNEDGRPNRLVESTTTSSRGRYSFNVPAGCYVIEFQTPEGFRIEPGHEQQAVCVNPGGSAARIDAIVYPIPPPSAPPDGCLVERVTGEYWKGVEVYEFEADWAESYTFFRSDGSVVARTRDLGPHDDEDGPYDYEWFGPVSGFNHREVWTVSAERNGVLSDQIVCDRE